MNTFKLLVSLAIIVIGIVGLCYAIYSFKYWKRESSGSRVAGVAVAIVSIGVVFWGVSLFNSAMKENYAKDKEHYNGCNNCSDGIYDGGNYLLRSAGFGTHPYNVTGMAPIPFQVSGDQNAGFYGCNNC